MPELRGTIYRLEERGEQGALFVQTETDIAFATYNRERGDALELVPAFGQNNHLSYYDIREAGRLAYVLIPRHNDRTRVANDLRNRFGRLTALHFQDFPRDHEAHLIRTGSELAAIAKT